ncbi:MULTISPECIES: MFS transporter [Paraburkholderia]|uniref:MFS transporter n=1 Tax=Paraburkholderia TaxID=1822464 RepID=UPI0038BA7973
MKEAAAHQWSPTGTPALGSEGALYAKVTRRLLPLLFISYLAAYLDRVNVGFAKLQMLSDLNYSQTVYGFGAGIFFLGYVIFEVPSNIIMHRVGARLWIARIMFTWAILSALTAFVKTPGMFYLLRFLLGAAEAGFIPGILLYLTYWWPAARRGRITALFLAAIPVSGIVGGPLSGWILELMSNAHGLRGWQWLFLLESIPSLILGVVVIIYLPNSIAKAKWLTESEKSILRSNIEREDAAKAGHASIGAAFKSTQVWLLSVIYFGIALGIYVLSFWLPTLIKATGVTQPRDIGMLTAVPYLCAVFAMFFVCRSADRLGERRWHTIVPCLVCALGLAVSAFFAHNTFGAMIGLCLATMGASAAQAAFWSLPAAFLGGAAAAAGIALVNSVGNIAGFVSTYLVGFLADLTHSTNSSMYFFAALLVIAAVAILAVPARLVNR